MRKITKLETTKIIPVKRKRVAAYARVSSGKDAQFHSLSAQISYYNSYIGSRGDWELAGIYAEIKFAYLIQRIGTEYRRNRRNKELSAH